MREIDKKAVEASQNTGCFESFIKEHEFFILKCASKFSHQYVTKSHDEWSIALEAFTEAIRQYSFKNGNFLSFAELIIRRRLIDELRKQTKFQSEISVDPYAFSGQPEEEEEAYLQSAINSKIAEQPDRSLKEEIEALTAQLKTYGFSFYDLISCSPKAEKTKISCANAIVYMTANPLLCSEMRASKNLPLKIIEKNAGIPRKILERHRKYIIAGVEIITGDYPYLAEYMRPFSEEDKV